MRVEGVFCTRLCNADVEDGGLVFLWKVLSGSFEAERAIVLFRHFEDANGVSVRQPGDERPAVERRESRGGGGGIISQN